MKSSTRSVRLAVVPALMAAFALSACQDAAPTAAPPSSPAATAEATQAPSEESAEPSEESSAPETSESSESTEAAPSANSGGEEECESKDMYRIEREDVQPADSGKPQSADSRYGDSQVEITPGKVTVDTSAGDDYFPGEGNQTIIIPVTMEAKGGSFVVSDLGFGVSDGADEACEADNSTVISRSEGIQVETLEEGDKVTGKLAFAVPTGADLSKYTLNYASDYSSGEADIAWKLK